MNPKDNTFCQKFAIRNASEHIQKIDGYCGTMNDIYDNGLCNAIYRNVKTYECAQGDIVCQNARNKFSNICEGNTTDPRCKCINAQQLTRNRDMSIMQSLNRSIETSLAEIDKAIAATTVQREKDALIKGKVLVRLSLERYFDRLKGALTVANSQCLIDDCRDHKVPVNSKCNITVFSFNVCINNIDIVALMGGRVVFRGSQTCKITIGDCKDNKCPEKFKCEGGKCVYMGEIEDKPVESGVSWLLYIVIFIIVMIIILLLLKK